jgi:hypothetical protein
MKKQGPIHWIEYCPIGIKFVSIAGHVPPSFALHFDRVGSAVGMESVRKTVHLGSAVPENDDIKWVPYP